MRIPFFVALGLALILPVHARSELPLSMQEMPAEAAGPLGALLREPSAAARLVTQPPGSWAEYVVTLDGQPVGAYLRYVWAGRDEQGLWLEVWFSSRPGSAALAFRLLFELGRDGTLRVRRAWQKFLGGPAAEVELPTESVLSGGRGEVPARVETAAVMTRAGSFRAREFALGTGRNAVRFFVAESVPLFGLVRADLGRGQALELSSFGTNGRPVFERSNSTETSNRR